VPPATHRSASVAVASIAGPNAPGVGVGATAVAAGGMGVTAATVGLLLPPSHHRRNTNRDKCSLLMYPTIQRNAMWGPHAFSIHTQRFCSQVHSLNGKSFCFFFIYH